MNCTTNSCITGSSKSPNSLMPCYTSVRWPLVVSRAGKKVPAAWAIPVKGGRLIRGWVKREYEKVKELWYYTDTVLLLGLYKGEKFSGKFRWRDFGKDAKPIRAEIRRQTEAQPEKCQKKIYKL